MMNVLGGASVGSSFIPDLLFCLYQLMFAGCTAELVLGGTIERGALGPCLIFIFIWTTVVYDAVACWTWNSNGWIFVMGGLDFAGGGN
jgi:ammonium transporter, Amt family